MRAMAAEQRVAYLAPELNTIELSDRLGGATAAVSASGMVG